MKERSIEMIFHTTTNEEKTRITQSPRFAMEPETIEDIDLGRIIIDTTEDCTIRIKITEDAESTKELFNAVFEEG